MTELDMSAGAAAPSDLDALVSGADSAPLPDFGSTGSVAADRGNEPEKASPPGGPEAKPGGSASDALRKTVDDANRERDARTVPLNALLDERERRQDLQRRFDTLQAAEDRRREEAERAPPPDMFSDPEGYQRYQSEESRRARQEQDASYGALIRNMRIEMDEQFVRTQHGAVFDEALRAFSAAVSPSPASPAGNRALYDHIMSQRSPNGAMVDWFKQQKVLGEVGTDPAAYRQKLLDDSLKDPEFLQRAQEALYAQAASNPRFAPSQRARMPSLARAGTAAPASGGDAGIHDAESAFGGR